MNRFLVIFYMANGTELRDIWETDMGIAELHEELIRARQNYSYYEFHSLKTDSSRLTLLWNHVMYFNIEGMNYSGTQPIDLNAEDEGIWHEQQQTN